MAKIPEFPEEEEKEGDPLDAFLDEDDLPPSPADGG